MSYAPPVRHRLPPVVISPWSDCMFGMTKNVGGPSAGSWISANRVCLYPIYLAEPFKVEKVWWLTGTSSPITTQDIGIYQVTNQTTGDMSLIRSIGRIIPGISGTSVVSGISAWRVAANNAALTAAGSASDATSYTTASVTLRKGMLYLLSVNNSKGANADVISSVDNGPAFTSRSSVTFNSALNRVSIWSAVPTVDYTGTLVINFGGGNTQTGAVWSLNEFSGVDTATNDGIVQQATGSGSSTTPLATLGAFSDGSNATFGAIANTTDTTTTPGSGFTELSDTNAATPTKCLETEWSDGNDTTVNATITSLPWGACAVEIKADKSPFVIPASEPGNPRIYMAMTAAHTVAALFRINPSLIESRSLGVLTKASISWLPPTLTSLVATNTISIPMAGFSRRVLLN